MLSASADRTDHTESKQGGVMAGDGSYRNLRLSSLGETKGWDESQAASAEDSSTLWPGSCRPVGALQPEMAIPLDRFVYRVGHR